MEGNDFERAVVNTADFYSFCERNGHSIDNVLTSLDFEKDKKLFDSKKLADLGLLDPQFSSEMPSDQSITKSILPFSFVEGSVFAMVYGKPNVTVKEHSHTKGFLRVVMFGEYTFTGLPEGDVKLTVGDWIYIPKNQSYGYVTGPQGGGGGCCYCTNGR
ncbi:MAG: hypothetical protein V7731_01960 [Amphritea sp.]